MCYTVFKKEKQEFHIFFMSNLKKNNGFTLLEIIFVLAIIGFITTIGVSYISKLGERAKEKTTSIQIQQILQAAMSYYVQQQPNRWPDNGNPDDGSAFSKNYLPEHEHMSTNPWGHSKYEWSFTDQINGIFQVKTDLPSSNTAKRVAALMPNAYVENNTTLKAEIGIPGTGNTTRGYVISAGAFNIKSNIDHDCKFSQYILSESDNTTCTNKGMHVQILGMMQSLHVRFKYGSLNAYAPEPKIFLLKEICKMSNPYGYGFEYLVRGDSPSHFYFNIYGSKNNDISQSSSLTYIAMCLPGAPDKDHDLTKADKCDKTTGDAATDSDDYKNCNPDSDHYDE